MPTHIDDFHERVARRNANRTLAAQAARKEYYTREDLEIYFLIFGVLYGGATALFAVYCANDPGPSDDLIRQGDIEFAVLRTVGGYWLYVFWPMVVMSLSYGMVGNTLVARVMKTFGFGALVIAVALRGMLYLFGG